MIIGKVQGSVVSTRKNDQLVGFKLLIVDLVQQQNQQQQASIIAVDKIGAGIGDYVLITTGSAARIGSGNLEAPIDAAVVGILDEVPASYLS